MLNKQSRKAVHSSSTSACNAWRNPHCPHPGFDVSTHIRKRIKNILAFTVM